MKPLVSVVIPVFNVEKYLKDCLESVIHQTYTAFEAIIVDDGSTDSSGNICDIYLSFDPRVRVIHQLHYGLGHARNVGMKNARGDYIIFLDSDDYWRLDTLEKLVTEAKKKNLDVVVFSAQIIYDGIKRFRRYHYKHCAQNDLVKNGRDSFYCAVKNKEYYSQACLRFYRFDYLKKYIFKFDENIIHEDESFSFLAYINAERIECLGEKYYYRRYRNGSIMMNLDPVKSANGYRTAIDTTCKFADNFKLCLVERKLYYKMIISWIFSIYSSYHKCRKISQADDFEWNQAKSIAIDSRKTIKLCSGLYGFPLIYRLAFRNFRAGYMIWKIHYILNYVKRIIL